MAQEEWPGTVEVVEVEEHHEVRARPWVLAIFTTLVVAFAAYGMAKNDPGILTDVFELVRDGMLLILGWLFGRQRSPP